MMAVGRRCDDGDAPLSDSITPAAFAGMPIAEFLGASPAEVLGRLTAASKHDVDREQRDAWQATVALLQQALVGLDGYLYLEFDVPRLGSRIDAVVITGPAIIPIEFKVGEAKFHARRNQSGLGLRARPEELSQRESRRARSSRSWSRPRPVRPEADGAIPRLTTCTSRCAAATTASPTLINAAQDLASGPNIDPVAWGRAPYHPTPTIIEAARSLYSRHSVQAITRSDAGAKNLAETSTRVDAIIAHARSTGAKAIVFVTGVPGAGKTLVGLNIATEKRDTHGRNTRRLPLGKRSARRCASRSAHS